MNTLKVFALGTMVAASVIGRGAFAQDDLDDLLNDLEGEAKKSEATQVEAKAETAVAEAADTEEEKPAATVEVAKEEPAAVEEDKSEAPAAEVAATEDDEKAEEASAAAEEAVAEAPAAAPAEDSKGVARVTNAAADEVLNLLDALAAESNVTPAAAPASAPAEVAAADDAAPAAAPVAAKPVAAKPVNPDAELIANIRATEKLRREALDVQAKREIVEARQCMSNGEYEEAVRHYGLSVKMLNDRQSSKSLRRECDQGIAEGLFRAAVQKKKFGQRDRALKLMEKACAMRHPKAPKFMEKWLAEGDKVDEVVDNSAIAHRLNDSDYKLSRDQIRAHLRRSRQYLAVRDMARALEECEVVLVNDPYNQDAIRLRNAIQLKRKVILQQERQASRDGMIADVDEAWRPVYAVNAAKLNTAVVETVKKQTGEDPERSMEQDIEQRMKEMRLPSISFKPPATIIDAVEFFRQASRDYDRPDRPIEKRGFNFVLKTPQGALKQQEAQDDDGGDDFASNNDSDSGSGNGLPPIPTITASDISFYEALKLVCESVEYKFIIRYPVVMVMPKGMSTDTMIARKYDVLDAFLERMTSASQDVKEMKSAGFGGGGNKSQNDDSEENQDRDWKEFFKQMGVNWPEGSSIMYIKTLGKLYVRNTLENLAVFEKVLQDMGSQPKLIEIETRFVEVAQEDLNSLGFEWILNSDYSLDVGKRLGKALGVSKSTFGSELGSKSWSESSSSTTTTLNGRPLTTLDSTTSQSMSHSVDIPNRTAGGSLIRQGNNRTVGFNAFGGNSEQQNGNRYLSTTGNHIAGQSNSINDQFMRVNAFLGQADLSMILHMLSQRSDTDLLSAPKVVTKSGENAVIKVVTEYIYPQDYDVQLQSSSSSSGSGSGSGGSQSAILAVVEPQNFTMREVGVILDVTPTYSEANGGTIDLELKPRVVDEPVWHNYGMRLPFSGNTSSGQMADIGGIFTGMANALESIGATLLPKDRDDMAKQLVSSALTSAQNVSASSSSTMTWYDAPMEQPFFHVRSIDSKVSITPGATVVMGGLITESRKAMDDKIPFLGDLPYIGRLFRSHAEQTVKRNLLIFVTGRLITPAGRELSVADEPTEEAEVKAAPTEG